MAFSFITAIVGYAVEAVATTILSGTVLAGTYAATAIAGVAGLAASGLTAKALGGSPEKPQSVSAARAQGILINTASTVEALPVIYGSRRVGGSRVFVGVSGTNNEILHVVVALCEGEIEEITNVYFDNILSTDARFTGFFTIEKFLGTTTQAASSNLVAACSQWTTAHQGKGVAYVYAALTYNDSVWHGIPTITADVKGRKVYNPDTAVTEWTNNPVYCIRDYLTNDLYGRGIPSANIDDTTAIASADFCDEIVNTYSGGSQTRYTCDGVVDIDNTLFNNINDLMTSCRGFLIKSGQTYKILIDKVETPTSFEFNESNISGQWVITQSGRVDRFNRVRGDFFDANEDWQPNYAIADSAAYRTVDNDFMLEGNVSLPFTNNIYRAQQLAGLYLKSSRFGVTVKFTAFQEGLRVECGDVVPITHTMPGWESKPFRIMSIAILDNDLVEITAREYDDTAYDLDTLTEITGADTVTLPDPFTVATPTGLTLSSNTVEVVARGTTIKNLLIQWTAPADTFAGDSEIQADINDGGFNTIAFAKAQEGYFVVSPVQESDKYTVRMRHRNSLGIFSDWSATVTHWIKPPSDFFWNSDMTTPMWDADTTKTFWSF